MIEIESAEAEAPLAPFLRSTLSASRDGVRLLAGHTEGYLYLLPAGEEPQHVQVGAALAEIRACPPSMAPNRVEPKALRPGQTYSSADAVSPEIQLGAHARVLSVTTKQIAKHNEPTRQAVAESITLGAGGALVVYRGETFLVPDESLSYLALAGTGRRLLLPLARFKALFLPTGADHVV